VTTTVTIGVGQARPMVTWATPAAIPYGTALSATQLDATASVPGTFVYTPALRTVLPVGMHTLSVTFTPTDAVDYTTATASVTILVVKGTPVLRWSKPKLLSFGTALGANQLDATANIAGTFTYSPAAGTVLGVGTRALSVTFTPTDTADYTSASASTQVQVRTTTTKSKLTFPSSVPFTTQSSATFAVTVTPRSGTTAPTGTVTVSNGSVVVCTATLDGTGVGRCSPAPGQLTVGTHRISAVYAGAPGWKASKAPPSSLTITP
jgi:hypothetical protein